MCVQEGTRPACVPPLLWCIPTSTLKDVCVLVFVPACVCSVILWWAVTSPLRLPSHASQTRRWVSVYFLWLRRDLVLLRQWPMTFCHPSALDLCTYKKTKGKSIIVLGPLTSYWDHSVGAPFYCRFTTSVVRYPLYILTSMWEFYICSKPWWSEIVLFYRTVTPLNVIGTLYLRY